MYKARWARRNAAIQTWEDPGGAAGVLNGMTRGRAGNTGSSGAATKRLEQQVPAWRNQWLEPRLLGLM